MFFVDVVCFYFVLYDLGNVKVVFESLIIENGNWKFVWENNCECYYCGGNYLVFCWIFFDDLSVIGIEGGDMLFICRFILIGVKLWVCCCSFI